MLHDFDGSLLLSLSLQQPKKKNPAVVAGSLLSSLSLTTDFGGCFCCQLQNLSAPAVSQCRKLVLQKKSQNKPWCWSNKLNQLSVGTAKREQWDHGHRGLAALSVSPSLQWEWSLQPKEEKVLQLVSLLWPPLCWYFNKLSVWEGIAVLHMNFGLDSQQSFKSHSEWEDFRIVLTVAKSLCTES